MESLVNLFSSLEKKIPVTWILLIFMVLLFIEFKGMAKDISHIQKDMAKDISHIQKDLENHIGDTNKKIDRLSDRFDRLYEVLLNKKKQARG